MRSLQSVAFIGNYLPRHCGIATFTTDLHRAVCEAIPEIKTAVVAMTDVGCDYRYPSVVRFQICDANVDEYIRAASYLNNQNFDVVCLQHEYGIFGGEAGEHVLELLSGLEMPLVTTLHTVLAKPSLAQRRVMSRIIDASVKVVVMAQKGRELLRSVFDVPDHKIEVIEHGIPDFPFVEPEHAKAKMGFAGKKIILTFGLLSPSKGIETVIDAMPSIIASCPNAVYVVLGATHPNLLKAKGEEYRDGLVARVQALGVAEHVVFLNEFVDQHQLLDFISMCDVYVTPYLNEAQMTSGTLAYSFGLGKAVVSTPYWHAQELLADGRGILVPFGNSGQIGREISTLLTCDESRNAMRVRAYAESRSMVWEHTAEAYTKVFEAARLVGPAAQEHSVDAGEPPNGSDRDPGVQIAHFLSMCDDTGMLQHSIHSVADRSHGYCTDDNSRALMYAVRLLHTGDPSCPDKIVAQLAAFIQHAWNPAARRFRNFMSYDRRWLEESGSEDSHGRALWSLAESAEKDTDPSRRRWAAALFKTALPPAEGFSSPRAWAFTLLGLDTFSRVEPLDRFLSGLRIRLANKLMARFEENERNDWVWFEDILAYDNARLPQAMIVTGAALQRETYLDVGIRSLRWLMSVQVAPRGHFRPVGSASFGRSHQLPEPFDQQPVEATASISACLAAFCVDGDERWLGGATSAFRWFLGENDLHLALADLETGGCCDGLHPDRVNQNKGAESTLSYLLAQEEMRRSKLFASDRFSEEGCLLSLNGVSAIPPQAPIGSAIAPIPLRKPAESVLAPRLGESGRQAV